MPYSSGFASWVQDTFKVGREGKGGMFPHQQFVKEFMGGDSPFHGMLLYHGLGVGKTRSAVEIAAASADREVIVLLPASLKTNFVGEIEKAGQDVDDYTFISYNGLNKKTILKYTEEGFFNNKLIIIDEVHNFMSAVSGSGIIGKRLYQLLMDAQDIKIVALSGTPIINSPIEVGYLLNLLNGYIYTMVYKYTGYTNFDALEKSIMDIPEVATCYVDTQASTVTVSFLPGGYEKEGSGSAGSGKVIRSGPDLGFKKVTVDALLKKAGLSVKSSKNVKNMLFPFHDDSFDDYFVNYGKAEVKNELLFARRAQGLVSYYEHYDQRDYPEARKRKVIEVPMSKTHFGKYLVVRQKEIEKEQAAARYKARHTDEKDEIKNGNVWRSFSRAVCNFAFPQSIKRPLPSTMKYDVVEGDAGSGSGSAADDEVAAAPNFKKEYEKKVAACLKALTKQGSVYLTPDGMREHGAKMQLIIDNVVKAPGPCLVYSMFRNVEGLCILGLALEQQGWSKLSLTRTGTKKWLLETEDWTVPHYIVFSDKPDENRILMNLFNNDLDELPETIQKQIADKFTGKNKKVFTNLRGEFIKMLMITKSGAEGISLKNVRQVHIMESYWNDIRIQQIMGRAVRAKSHMALPKDERVVDTFVYLTVLTPEQKEHPLIKAHDNGFTSDGYIYNIATKKTKINEKFLQLLKNTAVDCRLHKKTHGSVVACFKPPHTKQGYVYHVGDISLDAKDEAIVTKKEYKSLGLLHDGRELVIISVPSDKDRVKFRDLYNETFDKKDEGLDWNGIFFKDAPTMKNIVGLIKGKSVKWIVKPNKLTKIA